MIQFKCPGCGKAFRVDDSAAGKHAKCQACGQNIRVPADFVRTKPVLAGTPPSPAFANQPDFNAVLGELGLLSADELPRDIERESELVENASQPVNLPSDPTPSKDPTVAHLAKIEKLLEAMVERSQRPKEYKVVVIENKLLTAQFDPMKIAALLNNHARDGWSVKGMAEFDPPSFTGNARAIIVVMER
jgi:DNA-directed RNA polymerase subunit RPC12/RpoP